MSRLYLVFLFVILQFSAFSQTELSKLLRYGDELYDKGNYVYALEYYQKALQIDSNSVTILWKYAEINRAYKDYRKAEYYYAKVYDREGAGIFPESILYLGLMQKQNGKYNEALESFKKAKAKYHKRKKEYLYMKAKQEIESCLWAKSALIDTADLELTALPETVNSANSEFGHSISNGKLFFSSLRADSIAMNEEVFDKSYKTHIYTSVLENGKFLQNNRLEDLFYEKWSTGNGSYSLDGSRFYFSFCEDDKENYKCKILVAQFNNNKWFSVDTLGEIINEPGANTTMPSIGKLGNEEVLFFSSDREDGEGGMDIYYSSIKNGNQYGKAKSLRNVNSPDNDITPWFDSERQKLYFSSSWLYGFGGYDVFEATYAGAWKEPVNLGIPINSSANDLYYFKNADTSYFTTNRIGVLYAKNPTCCSDIFEAKPPKVIIPPTPKETLADLNKRLPVTLYFHNDIPDPRSKDTTTKVNYINSYHDYRAMLEKYQKEYSTGLTGESAEEAKEDIESFFIEYVDQGVEDLELFRDLLFEELEKGAKIKITIKGFASPLAKTDYNVNLTKRRIQSLVNYLNEYDGGKFKPYLQHNAANGGKLLFSQVPFGEYTADQLTSDNPNDQKNSVYSRAAAIERKIEVQSVSYMEEDTVSFLESSKQIEDLGKIKEDQVYSRKFKITNTSDKQLTNISARIPCDCNKTVIPKASLAPGESMEIEFSFDPKGYKGQVVKSIYLSSEQSDQELRLILSAEVE